MAESQCFKPISVERETLAAVSVFHMCRPAKEATVHLKTTLVAPRGVSVEAAVASVISDEHFFTERQEKNNSTAGFTRSKLCFFS